MNWKRLIVASAAIVVFALIWNGVVHGVILREANEAIAGIRRQGGGGIVAGLLMTVSIALLFVWSYARCARRGGLRDGLTHGLFFALLAGVLVDLNQYILYPIPGTLVLSWFGFALLEFAGYGLLATWLYPVTPARQTRARAEASSAD
jgi:hypothetical protein